MTDTRLRRLGRSASSLYHSGMLAPVAGFAVMGGSVWAMSAAAAVWPELMPTADGAGMCNPLAGDFGCGHGFGCACHMLPGPEAQGPQG